MHVCRRWRQVIVASLPSPSLTSLHICTPVRKYLCRWLTTFPIAINYNISNGITPDEDDDNIFAAFEHSNRVYLLNLRLTLVLSSEWTFYGIGAIFTSTWTICRSHQRHGSYWPAILSFSVFPEFHRLVTFHLRWWLHARLRWLGSHIFTLNSNLIPSLINLIQLLQRLGLSFALWHHSSVDFQVSQIFEFILEFIDHSEDPQLTCST